MLDLEDRAPTVSEQKIEPIHVTGSLSVMSMGFLLSVLGRPRHSGADR